MSDSVIYLENFLQSYDYIEIPSYHRNYIWGQEECLQLFNDISYLVEHPSSDYFLGMIIGSYQSGHSLEHINVIQDGQQRLVSIILLVHALVDLTDDLEESHKFLKLIKNKDDSYKLRFSGRNHNQYVDLTNKHNRQENNLAINYNKFCQLIKQSKYQCSQFFEALLKIKIAFIDLKSNFHMQNSHILFERLNYHQKTLDQIDLIRNFVLNSDYNFQKRECNNYWNDIEQNIQSQNLSQFIKVYLIYKNKTSIKDKELYKEYKKYFQTFKSNKDALLDLLHYSKQYQLLKTADSDDMEFNQIMNNINEMNLVDFYPYFLKLLNSNLPQKEINQSLELIMNYAFRYLLCRDKNNKIKNLSLGLLDCHNYEELIQYLLTNGFVTDDELLEVLQTKQIYTNRQPRLDKITLCLIESSKSKEVIDLNDCQVEHIWPQKLSKELAQNIEITNNHAKYCHTLGNLTLTKYNQEMSNNSFEFKRNNYYQNSNIFITRTLANYQEWNEQSICKRNEELCQDLLRILPYPKINNNKYSLLDDDKVTGQKPSKVYIADQVIEVNSWKELFVVSVKEMYKLHPNIFELIKEQNPKLYNQLIASDKLRSPIVIVDSIMIETNYSAKDILKNIRRLANIVNMEKEIYFQIN